jgi:hypothetical protein
MVFEIKLINNTQKILIPCEISINALKTKAKKNSPKFDKILGCYNWIKVVWDKDFHPCILIPIAHMDQMSRHHPNLLNSGSMSSSPISDSNVSAVGSNRPYYWNTRGLELQY